MPPSRRNDLIDAAMQVFYRHGFHGTGIDRVLQEGGISRMTLYNHFKSKDELIVAALRRRDEIFRNQLMKFVDASGDTPRDQVLGVFDFLERWFAGDDFCGCMFINATAEFSDPADPVRAVTAEHKCTVGRLLRDLCGRMSVPDPQSLADELAVLVEGSIIIAQVIGQTGRDGTTPADAAGTAKRAARTLIDAACAASIA